MRTADVLIIAALSLLPAVALAQQSGPSSPAVQTPAVQAPAVQTPVQTPAPEPTLTTAFIDFGAGVTGGTGDLARYQRYRDLSNGIFFNEVRFDQTRPGWTLNFKGDHVGREDERFRADVAKPGRLYTWGLWDQIPMLMSQSTQTLFTIPEPNVLRIADQFQQLMASTPSDQQPAVLNGIVNQASRPIEVSSQRKIGSGGLEYLVSPNLTLTTSASRTDRDGSIPFGGSFGHSQVVETLSPVSHQTTAFDSTGEYTHGRLLLRMSYDGSWFHNDFTSLTFDNPWRAVDSTSGGADGQLALAPSNSFNTLSGMASMKFAGHSRASLYLSTGFLQDAGEPLLPFTINSTALINGAPIPLPRTTVEGKARTSSLNAMFTSRPSRWLDLNARFRTYDYNNQTPEFDITNRVAYDNKVSAAVNNTEAFSVDRHTFDGDWRMHLTPGISAGAGYSFYDENRTFRVIGSNSEHTGRVVFDMVGTRWFSVRTKYEHGQRRGVVNDEVLNDITGIDAGCTVAPAGQSLCNEHAELRQWDIADRDRDRFTVLGSITPSDLFGFTVSAAHGRDNYPTNTFGLKKNDNDIYTAGFTATPWERIALNLSYSWEHYVSLSASRQADPGPQFFDPTRNWQTNGDEHAQSLLATLDLYKIFGKVDIKLGYDYNLSTQLYGYTTGVVLNPTLPDDVTITSSLTPAGTPCNGYTTCLPTVKNELHRASVDFVYPVNDRVSFVLTYWHEQYRVQDWSLDAQAIPQVDLPGALLLGYQYLPYTAHTVWAHATYRW